MKNPSEIKESARKALLEKQKTWGTGFQKHLWSEGGLSSGQVSQFLNGKKGMDLDKVKIMCDLAGLNWAEIIGENSFISTDCSNCSNLETKQMMIDELKELLKLKNERISELELKIERLTREKTPI